MIFGLFEKKKRCSGCGKLKRESAYRVPGYALCKSCFKKEAKINKRLRDKMRK